MVVCPGCATQCDDSHRFCPSCGFPISELAKESDDPLVGRTLPGGYVVLELIGVGGMGRVYRGEQQALSRTVAVKVIHQHLAGDESAAARFITEARAASRLNHPNSVGVIDFGKTDQGAPYLVMEYLRGQDLARVLYDQGPLPFRRVIDILRQVLAALGEAHELGIIHRDLKPENIIVEPMRGGGDFVKVVDFGLAKMRVAPTARNITRPGIVCGTPDYMAPEQGRGDELDARADLYAVGVILFLMLTNRLPFEADSPTQVVLMHLSVPPPDPRKLAADRNLPDSLAEVCLKALAKNREDRFQNADEFAAALAAARVDLEEPRPSGEFATCPSCGFANPRAQKFCGECGVRLSKSISAEEIARVFGAKTGTQADARRAIRVSSWPKFPLPLTARADDLAWLEDRRLEADGGVVGARIVAEEGMGKSRLVREFIQGTKSSGDAVVEVSADPWWADVGYYSLRRAIIGLAELPPDGGTPRDWLGAATEARRGLSEIFQSEPSNDDGLRAEDRRYLVAEALRWALVRAAQRVGRNRVVLAIEDLQRVDGPSRNAFADALGEPPLVPVLVIATHTPGFDAGWSAAAAARILSGIPATAATELLRGRGGSTPPPRHETDARGVPPMYVEHLIRFTRDGGSDPPTRLADLLALRIERIAPDARRTLQAMAVLGDAVPKQDVQRLVGDVELDTSLTELIRSGFVEPIGHASVRIAHPLLREVVAATIPAAVRRELHESALALCNDAGLPIEVRALHALHAQDSFEALLLLEQVATHASARGDVDSQVLALRRGLELARHEIFRGELDDPTRAVVIFGRKLGEALTGLGNFTDADGVLREALDLAGPSGNERARVLGALAAVAHGRARDGEASELLREAIDLASRSGARDLVRQLEGLRADFAAE